MPIGISSHSGFHGARYLLHLLPQHLAVYTTIYTPLPGIAQKHRGTLALDSHIPSTLPLARGEHDTTTNDLAFFSSSPTTLRHANITITTLDLFNQSFQCSRTTEPLKAPPWSTCRSRTNVFLHTPSCLHHHFLPTHYRRGAGLSPPHHHPRSRFLDRYPSVIPHTHPGPSSNFPHSFSLLDSTFLLWQ